VKREYLIPANLGLIPNEKWESSRNAGLRQFFTKPRFCWIMRSPNNDWSKLKARIAKVRMCVLIWQKWGLFSGNVR